MARKNLSAKEKICNIVLEIMREKSVSDIRISELTERANIARASFYRNFNSFDEVLDCIADRNMTLFIKEYSELNKANSYEVWYKEIERILNRIYLKKDTYTKVLTENLTIVFEKMVLRSANNPDHEWSKNVYSKYQQIAQLTALYAICMTWIKNGSKESIEEMTAFILKNIFYQTKVA